MMVRMMLSSDKNTRRVPGGAVGAVLQSLITQNKKPPKAGLGNVGVTTIAATTTTVVAALLRDGVVHFFFKLLPKVPES